MKEIGLNKQLYDRRLEMGYSLKKASSSLGISKLKLELIENGYLKANKKVLKDKFISEYDLPSDFFENEGLGYPTPLDEGIEEVDISNSKFVKVFKNIWFKLGMLVLSFGFVGMMAVGMYRFANGEERSFFSDKYVAALNYADQNGTSALAVTAKTSELLLCNYKAIEYNDETKTDGFDYESLNFFPKYDEYIGFAFFKCYATVDIQTFLNTTYNGKAEFLVYYESRMTDTTERVHFYAFDKSGYLPSEIVHFSADYDYINSKFKYNLIESLNSEGRVKKEKGDSETAKLFKKVFEGKFQQFENSKERFLKAKASILNYSSLEEFNTDQIKGLSKLTKAQTSTTAMIVFGIALGTLFFAVFVLAIIITTAFGKKFMKAVTIEKETEPVETSKYRDFEPLPKNTFPSPFIPEFIIRIISFILMVIGSMSLYYIFNSIINGDIIGTLDSLQYRATVASFTTLGMILIFVIKMDIIQSKKNTFLFNYSLFFAGFVFYVLTILLNNLVHMSPALERFSIILDFLPGNIVWGILAFNLLVTILLTKPKFEKNVKRNTIIYRCMAVFPLGYMIASSVVQIGKKTLGWNIPFAISSLFFTKALIITAFTILYCIAVYVYRRIIEQKYGKENAEMYFHGNKYLFIKNLLVVGIFIVLGLMDFFLGKNASAAKVGFGSNQGIFVLIPIVLLYHPFTSARSKTWDFIFNVAYGFSLMIGIVTILSSISVYITSL